LIRLLIINCLQHYQVNGLSYRLSKTLDLHDLGSTDYQLHSIFPSTIFYSRVSILGIYFITGLIKSTVDICIHIIVIILHSKLQTDEDELPACFKFQLKTCWTEELQILSRCMDNITMPEFFYFWMSMDALNISKQIKWISYRFNRQNLRLTEWIPVKINVCDRKPSFNQLPLYHRQPSKMCKNALNALKHV
jgi:hypothetical protein